MALSFTLTPEERAYLTALARQSIEAALIGKRNLPPPSLTPENQSPTLLRHLGSFVTLSLHGNLRGCIGNIIGREPLYCIVWNMARAAAFADSRFPVLTPAEWAQTDVHISVLDEPSLCPDPSAVEVGRHGLVLQYNGRSGVFLPQVPVEQGWDRTAYLENLCRKAGLPAGSWKEPGAQLFWYEALVF